ncbi:MAG: hypothetical protein FWE45_01050 [Firmicutes bacterium]|nr:hypothetical protein [Bacillota bacterium]
MSRKIITIIAIVVIVFGGGLAAILINNAARAFTPVAHSITSEQRFSVTGNGGNAVSIGNYLFFIGNYVPSHTIRYRQNEHNNVSYGAIYRVTLGPDGFPTYDNTWLTNETDLGSPELNAEYHEGRWNTRVANKRLIVPKIAGHERSAMWIFGNHIIYTSPHNRMNRQGNMQTDRLDFFRVNLNGSDHRLLYTSSSTTLTRDDSTVAWVNGRSYLLVNDNNRLVRVNVSNSPGDTTTIARDVTSFAFPTVTNYFQTNPDNPQLKGFGGAMNFVYWTENRTANDNRVTRGNIMRRFDISNGTRTTIGEDVGVNYRVVSISGGNFIFTRQDLDLDPNPSLFIADRVFTAGEHISFLATDLLQSSEVVFASTETSGALFRFITLYNGGIHLYTRPNAYSQFTVRNTPLVENNVEEILLVTANNIYYRRGSEVRVIDFHGNVADEDRSFGTASERIDEINISFFQSRPYRGSNDFQAREFFFFMTTLTENFDDDAGEDETRTRETISVPAIVDRSGNTWILAVIDERFL